MLYKTLLILLLLSTSAMAETSFGGHAKYFYSYSDFPENSVFAENTNPYRESLGNLRLKLESNSANWNARLHYELNGLYSPELSNCFFRGGLAGSNCADLASDRRQFFDLSGLISESDDSVIFHRIDRLLIAYTTEKLVTRVGRQAISWGNGMVYNPLDLFNPFPPDAIDTEYKRGEDMVYLQGLFNNGADVQGLYIPRRDPLSGELNSKQSTSAAKYHWLKDDYELDLLAAKNYGDTVVGAAYTGAWLENVINASATLTHTDNENYWSVAANYNYSALFQGKNLSGFVELFYNGFGLSGKRHSVSDVSSQPALYSRLLRGELFTIGKYYLATGGLLEITPLLNLNPVLFINLGDGSAMLQLIATYSMSQNMDLLAGFNLPTGAAGTEFGGLNTDSPEELILAPANTLFARLAWYF